MAQPATTSAQSLGEKSQSAIRNSPLATWLTIERILWTGIILLAVGVRLLNLARFSLSDAEAQLGTATLDLLAGKPEATVMVSPFVTSANALIFTIFGASDVTARIVAALAGIVPVALTYRVRDGLGRWGALIAALLFAFSPTYLYASRTANGEIVAIAGAVAALVGAWEVVRQRNIHALYWIAVGAAIAFTAGQAAYTILLIVTSFAAITLALRSTRMVDVRELELAVAALRQSPVALRNAALVFALVAVASATTALLNPLGLQATLNIAGDWFAQFTSPANQSPSYFLQLIVNYEVLPFVFGLGGLFYYLARGDRVSLFFAWWVGLALTIYTLAPFKTSSAMLVCLVPLIWTSGRVAGDMLGALSDQFTLANEGVFVMLGLLTCGMGGLNLSGFAQDGQTSHLVIVIISFGMLLIIGVLAGGMASFSVGAALKPNASSDGSGASHAYAPLWRYDVRRGIMVVGVIGFIGLSMLLIHSAMNLAFNDADDPRELMVDAPTTMEARGLTRMLEDLSNRWEGDPHSAPVAADASIGPALRWYLRDFRTVRYFDGAPTTAIEPLMIVAAQAKQPGFVDYASSRLRWRWLKPAQPLDTVAFFRWLLFRGLHDVPPSYDIIVYAQKK
ncbi:MAG: glycosyltransferase family 39 protein [Chloroflexota bacterium]